ncbi:MAG: hypothetical protein MUE73_09200 [Planctomycetes bacterium]|nr:hypothetical protein [Planctomycetota bacterium]
MVHTTSSARALAAMILCGTGGEVGGQRLRGHPASVAADGPLPDPEPAAERRTNASFRFGEMAILKIYAWPEPGPHPEVETGLHLGERLRFPAVAPFLGWAGREEDGAAVAVLHAYLSGGETAWDRVHRSFAAGGTPDPREAMRLGQLTAELHRALADHRGDEAFRPEPPGPRYSEAFRHSVTALLDRVLPRLPELPAEEIRHRLLRGSEPAGQTMLQRIHGDYHLEQVRHAGAGLFVLDFEGEPDRPLAKRRLKHPPEKDLAGMLRSFHYAACAAGAPEGVHEPPSREFLAGYAAAGGRFDPGLLDLFLMEKAVYEAGYELDHRPDWLPIPLAGLRALLAGGT